ncbi:DUF1801 domain-containing protein [Naasia aerilata]|uniref:YdhG-like domain-containing protein n=1 Tax=Naasia aerilata TaxID=1162966 RepID=A0ABN6XK68_9MICO|nr:DUF1801 domain-containing protein [Naasia aerilata]BDZ45261.1 hypothetical protein GCM10025866_11700 [Naasia aerilata]
MTGSGEEIELFLAGLPEARQAEARELRAALEAAAGQPARLWRGGILGVGDLHYRYESGREGDTFVVGFAPRTAALVFYGLFPAHRPEEEPLLERLGPHRLGKGCLYVTRLDRVDRAVLTQLIEKAARAAA